MNILDENGESYFVTAFDHSTQEQGTATSKDAFTGGDINASLTQEVVELREEVAGHGTDQLLYLAGKDSGLVSDDLVDIAVFQDPGIERITLACDTVVRAFSDAQGLIANLNATPSSQTRYQIYETQIDDAKRNIEKFNQLKAALYGDFADGLLSHQDYTDLSEDYSRRADDLRIFIAELEKEKEKYSAGFGSKMQWALLVEKYKDQESLDAEMAAAFIETLTLFNDGHVEVAFRHRDEIEQVLYVAATRGKEAERYAG